METLKAFPHTVLMFNIPDVVFGVGASFFQNSDVKLKTKSRHSISALIDLVHILPLAHDEHTGQITNIR